MTELSDAYEVVHDRLNAVTGMPRDDSVRMAQIDKWRMIFYGLDVDVDELDRMCGERTRAVIAAWSQLIKDGHDPENSVVSALRGMYAEALQVGIYLERRRSR